MDFTKLVAKILWIVVFLASVTASLQTVNAYHERQVFYDDPYYYGQRENYDYPYYTHHQYHVISYRNHYARYNRQYYYPPPRYYRPSPYPRCKYPGDRCY